MIRSIAALVIAAFAAAAQDSRTFFESKVRPVLAKHCYTCHSAQARTPFAGLKVDSREALLRGGDHGPAIVPQHPEQSRLMSAIRHQTVAMPPSGKLADSEIEAIERWIALGAPWPEERAVRNETKPDTASALKHWAWQPVQAPVGASIDGLVRQRLKRSQLDLSPAADRRTLLRRLSIDLTGLTPATADYERLESVEATVDRLLASPQFGERWGRHWLDLARFSDAGFNNVRFGFGHVYRDWVIRAINADLPYDQFILQQLAADKIEANPKEHLAALGFLSLGLDPHRPTGIGDKIDDRIDTVTRTFLGLTVACARCHDHKYDPIPTRDYYSLFGVFLNTVELLEPTPIEPVPPDRYHAQIQRRLRQVAEYKQGRIDELRSDARKLEAKYREAAAQAKEMTGAQVENLARERNLNSYVLRRWIAGEAAPSEIPLADFDEVATEGDYNTRNNLTWQYRGLLSDYAYRRAPAHAPAVADRSPLLPAFVLRRGNLADPGEPVPRRFLSLFCGECPEFKDGSGRLELARAIADRRNPLTARVMVNRVWMQLFGEGLVRTPSDFGLRGEAPSHPDLLDHLAQSLMDDGWSVKRLIRRIVLSATYQQSSAGRAEGRAQDPENRLLWRQNRRRLDFESLRDSMLQVAGVLDTTIGGPSFSLQSVPAEPRRTLYAHVERERAQALLRSFNTADPEVHTPQRYSTTVPQQALFLMNSSFVGEQARRVAERSATVAGLYRHVLGRAPTAAEAKAAASFLKYVDVTGDGWWPWQYGAGALDVTAGRVTSFRPFRYFVNDAYMAGSLLPHREEGRARLTARGGTPGDDLQHVVIRRWTSPVTGTVDVTGTLAQALGIYELRFGFTNGVRGWLVHSRLGVLGTWKLAHDQLDPDPKSGKTNKVETNLTSVRVEREDTLDFVVDALDDAENDDFTWAPVIKHAAKTWSAAADFLPPSTPSLSRREQLAQVLLLTNEFAFVD